MPAELAVTADVLLLRPRLGGGLSFLSVQRRYPPFQGAWALPGGFVEVGEDLPEAATRELLEETALRPLSLSQLGAYGRPGRDPRRHTVTIAYVGFAPPGARARAGDDAADTEWHDALVPPSLAFDHQEILGDGLRWLRGALDRDEPPSGFMQSFGDDLTRGRLLALHSALGAGPQTASALKRWVRRGLWPV